MLSALLNKTHPSFLVTGQTFAYGEYIVSYVAYDAENNSAECSFGIIIKRESGFQLNLADSSVKKKVDKFLYILVVFIFHALMKYI